MAKHEQKTCPHCQQSFECRCGDIINCQCESVALEQAQRDYIQQRYDDCLCARCLQQLRSDYNIQQFSKRMERLIQQH